MKKINKESIKKGFTKVKSFVGKNKKTIVVGSLSFIGGIFYEAVRIAKSSDWEMRGKMYDAFTNDETGETIHVCTITPTARELYLNRGKHLDTENHIFVADSFEELEEKRKQHWS